MGKHLHTSKVGVVGVGQRHVTASTRYSGRDRPVDLALADMFFLLGHHPETRRMAVAREVLSVGVAAAIVGELLLGKYVVVAGDKLCWGVRYAGEDPVLTAAVAGLGTYRHEPTVREVVDQMSGNAYLAVARRLEAAGLLARRMSNSRWRRELVYLPAQYLPMEPQLRLNAAIVNRSATPPTALLAGLVATGGFRTMFDFTEDQLLQVAALHTSTATMVLLEALSGLAARAVTPRPV